MYAVVKTGGKQYKVAEGDVIDVEKIEGKVGSTVELKEVLFASGGDSVKIGTPAVKGIKVTAKILAQAKGPKTLLIKHLRRKDYRKKQGHRQWLTTLEIVSVN